MKNQMLIVMVVVCAVFGSVTYGQRLPANVDAHRDVEYGRAGDHSLKLDLYLPKDVEHPPLLVWIHGGGWRAGDKRGCRLSFMLAEGYAVASINYRLTDVASFPAQIHDCKGAIRWLRAHAKAYGYNADRIGIGGSSAGGHLVALLGTSHDDQALEGDIGGNADQSSTVQAVLDLYGPTDLISIYEQSDNPHHRQKDSPITKLLGGTIQQKPDAAKAASPSSHITADDPPHLILHGGQDPLVPVQQSIDYDAALRQAGVESTLIVLPDERHGGRSFFDAERRMAIKAFYDRHIRQK